MWTLLQTGLTAFLMVFLAEMADKTQLLVMTMSGRYRPREIVAGIAAAAVLLNLLAVGAGEFLASLMPMDFVRFVASLMFLGFALTSLMGAPEERPARGRAGYPVLAVAGAFFIAELGDKTQLSVVSLAAATDGRSAAIFTGATLGLLLADLLGLAAGAVLLKKLPEPVMKWLSFAVFTVFGFMGAATPLSIYVGSHGLPALAAIFVLLLTLILLFSRRRRKNTSP